ncbi:hypothetical protein BDZ89DRAFT_1115981 [Hymenopellis radicata]|nr:hypothetical protein BDZ89DRAFT_1115981 [Hymenopellis radicata]
MSRQHSHTTDFTNFSRATDFKTDFHRSDQFEARDSESRFSPERVQFKIYQHPLRDPEGSTVLGGTSVEISSRREMLKGAIRIPATKSTKDEMKGDCSWRACDRLRATRSSVADQLDLGLQSETYRIDRHASQRSSHAHPSARRKSRLRRVFAQNLLPNPTRFCAISGVRHCVAQRRVHIHAGNLIGGFTPSLSKLGCPISVGAYTGCVVELTAYAFGNINNIQVVGRRSGRRRKEKNCGSGRKKSDEL